MSPTSALTLVGARRRLPRRLRPARRTSTAPSVACSYVCMHVCMCAFFAVILLCSSVRSDCDQFSRRPTQFTFGRGPLPRGGLLYLGDGPRGSEREFGSESHCSLPRECRRGCNTCNTCNTLYHPARWVRFLAPRPWMCGYRLHSKCSKCSLWGSIKKAPSPIMKKAARYHMVSPLFARVGACFRCQLYRVCDAGTLRAERGLSHPLCLARSISRRRR